MVLKALPETVIEVVLLFVELLGVLYSAEEVMEVAELTLDPLLIEISGGISPSLFNSLLHQPLGVSLCPFPVLDHPTAGGFSLLLHESHHVAAVKEDVAIIILYVLDLATTF